MRSPEVRGYLSAFRQATGLSVRLVPSDEPVTRSPLGPRDNPFCALITQSTGGARACAEFQVQLRGRLAYKLAPQRAICFAGLTDLALPLAVEGDALEAMITMLDTFAKHIADSASRWMIAHRSADPPVVVAAREYVQAHWTNRVSVGEAARRAHLSSHYFCKLFKKATGLTFSKYVARARTEKAKELLLNRQLGIATVASVSGGTLTIDSKDAANFGGFQNAAGSTLVVADNSYVVLTRSNAAWFSYGTSPTNLGSIPIRYFCNMLPKKASGLSGILP
jgi:AraC-like DNA-binding protein